MFSTIALFCRQKTWKVKNQEDPVQIFSMPYTWDTKISIPESWKQPPTHLQAFTGKQDYVYFKT